MELYDKNYNELADEYKTYLETLGHQTHGATTKYRYLREFLHQLELQNITDITKVTSKEIEGHYRYLQERPSKKDGNSLSQKTIYAHMKSIQQLFTMLLSKNKIKTNPASALKYPYPTKTTERIILDQEEIKQLYKTTENWQERALLSLAYGCGLRVSELVAINIDDIKLRQEILIVPRGKGNKRRVVPLSPGVVNDLTNYFFKERDKLATGRDYQKGEQSFMLHSRGGRMMKYTYNKYLKRIIDRTNNETIKSKNITIHNLRHSIATHLLEQGVKVEQVREFLGHSQLETTEIYTRVSRKQLQNLLK